MSPDVEKMIASKGGYCNKDLPYPAYDTLHPNYKGIDELENVAQTFVTGQMCGTSSYGLTSMYSAPLELFSKVVGYGENNDGLVGYSSCALNSENFTSDFRSQFYSVEANHVDGTCRTGDAWFGSAKPCSFYVGKM